MEPPTNLLSGRQYSRDVFRRLVADGVLAPDGCSDPDDLSMLTEEVFMATQSQRDVTSRLPHNEWRRASPNRGHLAVMALLIEGSVRTVVTLNYDLALQNALSVLSSSDDVGIIRGPEDHSRMCAKNLIFLHRSVEASEDDWVLRKSALDEAWRDGWEEAMANGSLVAPITIFAGLGSPASVLTSSVERLSGATNSRFYLVDPYPHNRFVEALGEHVEEVLTMGWSDFAVALAQRVTEEQVEQIRQAAIRLAAAEGLPTAQLPMAIAMLRTLTLVALGQARAQWLLQSSTYMPASAYYTDALSDLMLGVCALAEGLNAEIRVGANAEVYVEADTGETFVLRLAHGGGVKSWSSVRDRLPAGSWGTVQPPRIVLVAGLRSVHEVVPGDLVRPTDAEDIIYGAQEVVPLDIAEVQSLITNPDRLRERLTS